MPTSQEARRLSHVYDHYRQDRATQRRWGAHNPGNRAILRQRREAMTRWLQRGQIWPLDRKCILDVGCGSGQVLAGLLSLGASGTLLNGVDLLPSRVVAARQCFPRCCFKCANAEELPYADNQFDLLLSFTIFSSILDSQMAQNVAAEMRRVLKTGGAILWYDLRFDNPRNRHVRGMTRQRIGVLFPAFEIRLQSITLLPPLARRLGLLTGALYPPLSRIPLLRTHYMGLLRKVR